MLLPGKVVTSTLRCIKNKMPVDATLLPTAKMLISGTEYPNVIISSRVGLGIYKFDFVIPSNAQAGNEIALLETINMAGEIITNLRKIGFVSNDTQQKNTDQLKVINNALKIISLQAGIPHTANIPE